MTINIDQCIINAGETEKKLLSSFVSVKFTRKFVSQLPALVPDCFTFSHLCVAFTPPILSDYFIHFAEPYHREAHSFIAALIKSSSANYTY